MYNMCVYCVWTLLSSSSSSTSFLSSLLLSSLSSPSLPYSSSLLPSSFSPQSSFLQLLYRHCLVTWSWQSLFPTSVYRGVCAVGMKQSGADSCTLCRSLLCGRLCGVASAVNVYQRVSTGWYDSSGELIPTIGLPSFHSSHNNSVSLTTFHSLW